MFGNAIIIYKEARLVQYSKVYPEGRHTSNNSTSITWQCGLHKDVWFLQELSV